MSLANQQTFTIGDLAKIALGGEEFANDRLYVLQNIFLVLLQKLDCHNETVKIKGLTAKCLQSLLNNHPHSCQYNFQFENVQLFQKQYHLLEELERKTLEIDGKIKRHFRQIRKGKTTNIFAADKWHIYASPTEDLGALCLKRDRKYWFLAENSVFNTELRRRVVPQVVGKLMKYEDRIEAMQNQLCGLAQMADRRTAKLKWVEFIIKDTECLRSTINHGEKVFYDAIAEVDEMLSCKLHRVTVPALKIYLEKRIDNAKRHLRVLQLEAKKCPPTKPLTIDDRKTCLSCCRHRDLEIAKKFKNLKSIDENIKCSCCNFLKDPSVMEKIERFELTASDPCSSRKSDRCENHSESPNVFGDIARPQETEGGEREKVLASLGPLA